MNAYEKWRTSGGKLTPSVRYKRKHEELFPYYNHNRADKTAIAWRPVLFALGLIGVILGLGRFAWGYDFGFEQQIAVATDARFDENGTFSESIVDVPVTASPFPTSNLVAQPVTQTYETVTPEPTATSVSSATSTAHATQFPRLDAYATATAIAEVLSSVENRAVEINTPTMQVTPANGRWVYGYYPPAFCPTGYECPCDGSGCIMQVPENYGCDSQGCGFGHGQ
ncbi:MAG: hypothetical protein AAFV93_01960 [Chloroflexota bacterium]